MKKGSHRIFDFYNLDSPFATEFRRLLHRLKTLGQEQELKVVMVTSANLAEGKSTICTLLSMTAAKKGIRTLLVDTDLRRPTLHHLLQVNREPGLTDVLVDHQVAKEVLQKTQLGNLDIITAGRVVGEPGEAFDAPSIGRLLTELKFYYDLIIVDCAPVIPVSDPMLLAPEVDGTLLVVRAGQTAREVAIRASDILKSSNARLCGAVVNNANNQLPSYYDHRYYGYHYPSPGASGRPNSSSSTSKTAQPKDGSESSGSGKPSARGSSVS